MEEQFLEYAEDETLDNFYGLWAIKEKKTTKLRC
jgi:hypothetical protein